MDKQKFLEQFNELDYGKCAFKLLDGSYCEGWIMDIGTVQFEFGDSSPWAREEPYLFDIEQIDTNSFAYYDEEQKQWVDYLAF